MDYLVAWGLYLIAGVGCMAVWLKITSFLHHSGWRDLARGIAIVLIFTPWIAGESAQYYAPALVVMLMDLTLAGTASGLQGGVALLISAFVMLLVLTIRQYRRSRPGL